LTHLTGPTVLGNGSFQFSFTTAPGVGFTVHGTNNITAPTRIWPVVGPATEIASVQYQFTDPQATTNSPKFYILVSP
jgi:hypothetical protein